MRSPDIEVYLHQANTQALIAWLQLRFPESTAPAKPTGKQQWKMNLVYQGSFIPVLIIEQASPGFSSVWFDSDRTPWENDQACARELFAHFHSEIRATPGSWQEGDDPDLWWYINASGEGLIQWAN